MPALVVPVLALLLAQPVTVSEKVHIDLRLAIEEAAPEYCLINSWQGVPGILHMQWQLRALPEGREALPEPERVSRWGVIVRVKRFNSVEEAGQDLAATLASLDAGRRLPEPREHAFGVEGTAVAFRVGPYVLALRAHTEEMAGRIAKALEKGIAAAR